MLNYKLVVERTLHVETPRGLALLSVGDEVFLKLHGYGWLFGTIIALGHDTMLVAGHDLDESKRVAYRWIDLGGFSHQNPVESIRFQYWCLPSRVLMITSVCPKAPGSSFASWHIFSLSFPNERFFCHCSC